MGSDRRWAVWGEALGFLYLISVEASTAVSYVCWVVLYGALELGESSRKMGHSVVVKGVDSGWAIGRGFWFCPLLVV